MVIATQKGAVRALDERKEERPQFATVLLWRWAGTTPLRPMHVARVVAIDPCPRCFCLGVRRCSFFVRR